MVTFRALVICAGFRADNDYVRERSVVPAETLQTTICRQKFIVPMRARPSLSDTGCAYFSNNSNDTSITLDLIGASTTYGELRVTSISMTAGHAGWLRIQGGGAFIQFDADL